MPIRRLAALAGAILASTALFLGVSAPAQAAVSPEQKLAVMSSWTQTSLSSSNAWRTANNNQGAWWEYGFDWSTDYCSSSPDNPFGFPFELSCARHDWGYRNYKAMGQFTSGNKSRIDSAFYEDLKRACDTLPGWQQPPCDGLAWTYYQAVVQFGYTKVTQADLDRTEAQLERAAQKAGVNR
ncbi:MAG: phospholipase [Micromonosporaceae bacterium]